MTSSDILKLITDEQHLLGKRKQTALARGQWLKAIEIEAKDETLQNLKKYITDFESGQRLVTGGGTL